MILVLFPVLNSKLIKNNCLQPNKYILIIFPIVSGKLLINSGLGLECVHVGI